MKKINELKSEVFALLKVTSTIQLKKEYKSIASGKDFRFKKTWLELLESLTKCIDLEASAKVIRQSMHRVGRAVGNSYQQTEDQIATIRERVRLKKIAQGKDRLVGGGI